MATRLGCKFNASTLGIQLSIHEVWQTWKLNQNSRTCNLPESKLDTLTTSCWSFASTLPPKTNKCLCKNCYCTLYILSFLICCSRSHVVPSPKVLLFVHLVIAPNQTPEVITYRFDSWRYQPNAPKPGLHSPHDISTLQARWKAWSFWFSKISIREETPRNSKKNECNMYIYIYTYCHIPFKHLSHQQKKRPGTFPSSTSKAWWDDSSERLFAICLLFQIVFSYKLLLISKYLFHYSTEKITFCSQHLSELTPQRLHTNDYTLDPAHNNSLKSWP